MHHKNIQKFKNKVTMLGSQKTNSSSQNPFVDYQTFYLNLFSNNVSSKDDTYVKGENDSVHFRVSLILDGEMKKNSEIKSITNGKDYYPLSNETKVTGYLKSISVIKDTVKNKPVKKVQITLFDPEAVYVNPFESQDKDNPKNNTVVGATYIIKTSFSLKGKELLSKLSNIDVNNAQEMISLIVVPANSKDSNYKEPLIIDGKKIFNILIKQGEEIIFNRFGNPSETSKIKHDKWNEEYLDILQKYEDEARRINMDNLFERFINSIFAPAVHSMFLSKLSNMGYNLVESGVNSDGSANFKYVKLGETLNLDSVSTYIEPNLESEPSDDSGREFMESELPF